MSFVTGSSKSTWEPIITADTTIQSYWINWRVLLCAIWLLFSAIFSLLLIWKYEFQRKPIKNGGNIEAKKETAHTLYEDETWRPCLKGIHPVWLLAFRVFAFIVLLVLLILIVTSEGERILYFYTQWTFIFVTIYFGLGSLLSMYGCYQHHKKASGGKVGYADGDADQRTCDAPPLPQSYNPSNHEKCLGAPEEHLVRKPAGTCGYIIQIMFQMNAGAVMLTDCVFWFLIVPCLTIKDYNINFLTIMMHTINAVFLLGDTALNCLRFPWFRIGYFCVWTVTYVLFQWIVHAFVKLWWPYPFLDLSYRYAPLWYVVAIIFCKPVHISVLFGGITAYSMLWHLRFDNEAETHRVVNAGFFNDVQRAPKLPFKAPREVKELDDNKSKQGLAEIYEQEYVPKKDPISAPLSFNDELHREAIMLFKKLNLKLDALTHFNFAPKPVIEDMSIQTNVHSLTMEELRQ